ncbi:MAG: hypothetical protein ACJ764_14480 [Solirubrobacteraceae bacterium]
MQKADPRPAPPLELAPEPDPEPDPVAAPPDAEPPEAAVPPPLDVPPLEPPDALPVPDEAEDDPLDDEDALDEPEEADGGGEVLAVVVVALEAVPVGVGVEDPPVGTVSRGCSAVPVPPLGVPPPQAAMRAAQAMPATPAASTRAAKPGRITLLMDPRCPAVPSAYRSACSR